jgi:hypothetical protein
MISLLADQAGKSLNQFVGECLESVAKLPSRPASKKNVRNG